MADETTKVAPATKVKAKKEKYDLSAKQIDKIFFD